MAKKTKVGGAADLKKQLWVGWTRDVIAHYPFAGDSDADTVLEFATDVADAMLEAYEELEKMLKTGLPRSVREEEEEEEEEEEAPDSEEEEEEDPE